MNAPSPLAASALVMQAGLSALYIGLIAMRVTA